MTSSRAGVSRTLSIAIACALVLLAGLLFVRSRTVVPVAVAFAGTPITPPKFAADAVLTDQYGQRMHLYDAKAAVTFLFFGYTHCPDACPLAMAALGRAYRSLSSADAARTRIVFVTVDPKRDTQPVMKRYAAAFDAHIVALTGTHAVLAPVWNAYGVTIDEQTKELVHGDAIYAIDATQHVVLIYPSDTKAGDLASDAARLAANDGTART